MVSVIVPVYNVEKYLGRCIESVIHQTCGSVETILSDDGSPDGCAKICDEYAMADDSVIVIHHKNKGVSATRNLGLLLSRGEYIGFVDPDDWVSAEMYQTMIDTMKNNEVELAICGYDYYDESGKIDNSRRYAEKENEIVSQKTVFRRFADMPPSIRHGVCNKIFLKSIIQKYKIKFNEKLHSSEDVLFLTEYANRIKNAVIVHKPFYKNTVRQGSATHGGLKVKQLADSFFAHEYMYDSCVERYKDLKDISLAFLLDVCVLKYNTAKSKGVITNEEKIQLKKMKRYIKKLAVKAIFDKEIYWKTRIMYLLVP